jgi:hypothetical protein
MGWQKWGNYDSEGWWTKGGKAKEHHRTPFFIYCGKGKCEQVILAKNLKTQFCGCGAKWAQWQIDKALKEGAWISGLPKQAEEKQKGGKGKGGKGGKEGKAQGKGKGGKDEQMGKGPDGHGDCHPVPDVWWYRAKGSKGTEQSSVGTQGEAEASSESEEQADEVKNQLPSPDKLRKWIEAYKAQGLAQGEISIAEAPDKDDDEDMEAEDKEAEGATLKPSPEYILYRKLTNAQKQHNRIRTSWKWVAHDYRRCADTVQELEAALAKQNEELERLEKVKEDKAEKLRAAAERLSEAQDAHYKASEATWEAKKEGKSNEKDSAQGE